MTLLLAALWGNVLAWLIHVVAWWLREKCLPVVAGLGILCSIPLSLATYALSFNEDFTGPSYLRVNPIWAGMVWLALLLVGFLQSYFVGKREQWLRFVSALLLEFLLAIIVIALSSSLVLNSGIRSYIEPITFKNSCLFVFFITMFLLAIFRPLVVRYSTRFWEMITARA